MSRSEDSPDAPQSAESPLVDRLHDASGRKRRRVFGRSWTRAAVELSVIFFSLGFLVALLANSTGSSRGPARRSWCKNNLKQLALAAWNYHDDTGRFPLAATSADPNLDELWAVRRRQAVSWRVTLLPYLDNQVIANRYDAFRRWDESPNDDLQRWRPDVFVCPGDDELPVGRTNYVAPRGRDTMWPLDARREADVIDGTSNTILLIDQHIGRPIWTQPRDVVVDETTTPDSLIQSAHIGGTQVALADGSVRFLAASTDLAVLQALLTPAGGEPIDEF